MEMVYHGYLYEEIRVVQVSRIVYAPLVARVQEKYAWIEYTMA